MQKAAVGPGTTVYSTSKDGTELTTKLFPRPAISDISFAQSKEMQIALSSYYSLIVPMFICWGNGFVTSPLFRDSLSWVVMKQPYKKAKQGVFPTAPIGRGWKSRLQTCADSERVLRQGHGSRQPVNGEGFPEAGPQMYELVLYSRLRGQ